MKILFHCSLLRPSSVGIGGRFYFAFVMSQGTIYSANYLTISILFCKLVA